MLLARYPNVRTKYKLRGVNTHPKEPAGAQYPLERPCKHSPEGVPCHAEAYSPHIVLLDRGENHLLQPVVGLFNLNCNYTDSNFN